MSGITNAGRQKGHIWEYFIYNSDTSQSKCNVKIVKPDGSEEICNHIQNNKYTTNLERHLQRFHPIMFEAYEKNKLDAKASNDKRISKQGAKRKHGESSQSVVSSYTPDHKKQIAVDRKLAAFIAMSSTPYIVVENDLFKDVLHELDDKYAVPSRQKLQDIVNSLLEEMKGNVSIFLQSATFINVTTDIWTKKGMLGSFLGVTAHFFAKMDHQRHAIALAVRRFSHPHTGERVLEVILKILDEWNIPTRKVLRVVTDNGSNMVKAFKDGILDEQDYNSQRCIETNTTNVGLYEESETESLFTDTNFNLGVEDDEIEEFNTLELGHTKAFSRKYFFKRLSCFDHCLDLVARKAECYSQEINEAIIKACKLIVRVNKSSKAKELLQKKAGRVVPSICPTRWSSKYLFIKHLLSLKDPLREVFDEVKWDWLQPSEIIKLENFAQLMGPFAEFTTMAEGETYTTISLVIPAIRELRMHMNDMGHEHQCLEVIFFKMQEDLSRRFMYIEDPEHDNFDPIYIVSVFLDPRFRELLSANFKDMVRSFLLTQFSLGIESTIIPEEEVNIPDSCELLVPQQFKHLNSILSEKKKEFSLRFADYSTKSSLENEIHKYMRMEIFGYSMQLTSHTLSS